MVSAILHGCVSGASAHAPHDAPARTSGTLHGRRRSFTVDLHCHALTTAVEQLVAERPQKLAERELQPRMMGRESFDYTRNVMLRAALPKLTDLELRLRDMDAMGVDLQLLSPAPNQYYYWAEPDLPPDQRTHRLAGGAASRSAAGPGQRSVAAPGTGDRAAQPRRARARLTRRGSVLDDRWPGPRRSPIRAVLGAGRAARVSGVSASARHLARRAAEPALPVEHHRSAARDRGGAVVPDFRRHAGSLSGRQDPRGPWRRLCRCLYRSFGSRLACAAGRARLPARAEQLSAANFLRHDRLSAGTAAGPDPRGGGPPG